MDNPKCFFHKTLALSLSGITETEPPNTATDFPKLKEPFSDKESKVVCEKILPDNKRNRKVK